MVLEYFGSKRNIKW